MGNLKLGGYTESNKRFMVHLFSGSWNGIRTTDSDYQSRR